LEKNIKVKQHSEGLSRSTISLAMQDNEKRRENYLQKDYHDPVQISPPQSSFSRRRNNQLGSRVFIRGNEIPGAETKKQPNSSHSLRQEQAMDTTKMSVTVVWKRKTRINILLMHNQQKFGR